MLDPEKQKAFRRGGGRKRYAELNISTEKQWVMNSLGVVGDDQTRQSFKHLNRLVNSIAPVRLAWLDKVNNKETQVPQDSVRHLQQSRKLPPMVPFDHGNKGMGGPSIWAKFANSIGEITPTLASDSIWGMKPFPFDESSSNPHPRSCLETAVDPQLLTHSRTSPFGSDGDKLGLWCDLQISSSAKVPSSPQPNCEARQIIHSNGSGLNSFGLPFTPDQRMMLCPHSSSRIMWVAEKETTSVKTKVKMTNSWPNFHARKSSESGDSQMGR
jgi:hypothetical protein